MAWMIISLSVLAAILVLALLMSLDGRQPRPVRAFRQPKPVGENGRPVSPIHSNEWQPDRRAFSMF